MKYGHSQEELDWLEKADFLLLKMSYDKAVSKQQKSFKIPISGFDGSPEYMHHLQKFAIDKGLTYESDGTHFIFHIS